MRDLDANFNVHCVLKMNTPTQSLSMILINPMKMSFEQNLNELLHAIKSTNFNQKNMQHHTESISFGLFLSLNITGTSRLTGLIFFLFK